ncbi:MAG: hypothetical protein AVDCRST_MAG19-2521 [uncultured Thermomicrobiales bacterium]|uniref:Uncharacterized protein n=1 Tax=uncultured Thermomicrobiales bacterium TaxID=1645740 RepID=A0A6J4V415_9BACT|nr:MAG: hypothetical protein AVDCRST_MAG19-2521 [uncultured Thermomicrobiales bacterium]
MLVGELEDEGVAQSAIGKVGVPSRGGFEGHSQREIRTYRRGFALGRFRTPPRPTLCVGYALSIVPPVIVPVASAGPDPSQTFRERRSKPGNARASRDSPIRVGCVERRHVRGSEGDGDARYGPIDLGVPGSSVGLPAADAGDG